MFLSIIALVLLFIVSKKTTSPKKQTLAYVGMGLMSISLIFHIYLKINPPKEKTLEEQGFSKLSLIFDSEKSTAYKSKKILSFKNQSEIISVEVDSEAISYMTLKPDQEFNLYYYKRKGQRCLYKLERNFTSVEVLKSGSKLSCKQF